MSKLAKIVLKIEDLDKFINEERVLYASEANKKLYIKLDGTFDIVLNGETITNYDSMTLTINHFNSI